MRAKKRSMIVAIVALGVLSAMGINGQNSPADSYYNNHIGSELPSQNYYNSNLRSDEWDDDGGPGGSGDGSNTGVGVPVGKAGLPFLACILAYGGYAYKRRKSSGNIQTELNTNK